MRTIRGMKVTNLLIWSQENTLSEKFYKKLGFKVTVSTPGHSEVSLGDFKITIVNMRDEDELNGDSLASDKGKGMYIYVRVDDVDQEYERQCAIGLAPYTVLRDWEWGSREFVTKDPDGYKLCFWQPLPTQHKEVVS